MVRAMVRRPGFSGLVEDALDALGKGYSATEIIWDRTGPQWEPQGLCLAGPTVVPARS